MGKNNGNLNIVRNQYLKKISESIQTITNNKNEKQAYVISIISTIISILAIAATIFVPKYEYDLDKINKPLLFDENVSIELDDESDGCNVSFSIKQGGIKKAYLAYGGENGELIYENIIENLKNDSLEVKEKSEYKIDDMSDKKVSIDLKVVNGEKVSIGLNYVDEKNLFDGFIKIVKIKDFSLILLDTIGQWWIYYFVTYPEVIPSEDAVYNFEVQNDDGDVIVSTQEPLDKQDMAYVMIDGTLTSTASIENVLQSLEVDYKLFSERREIKGENGEIFTSQPIMKNVYIPPRAEDIYNEITRIRNDINDLSLN